MTDHGFWKVGPSSNLRAMKKLAQEISKQEQEGVVSAHVVNSDKDARAPTYSVIALCKGVKRGPTQKALEDMALKSGFHPPSTEALLIKFTYKGGDHITPVDHPHAFGCHKPDEP